MFMTWLQPLTMETFLFFFGNEIAQIMKFEITTQKRDF